MRLPQPNPRRLRRWLIARVLLSLLGALSGLLFFRHHYALTSEGTNLHAVFKALVYSWHNLWFRREYLLGALALSAGAAALLPRREGARWWLLASLVALVSMIGGWSSHRVLLAGATALLLYNLKPEPQAERRRPWEILAWLPGSLLLLPLPVARQAGIATSTPLRILSTLLLATLWFGLDHALCFERYRYAVTRWPDHELGREVQIVEKARNGDYFDYHDIDLVGDRLVVVGEQTHRLMSFDLEGRLLDTWRLPEKWMPPNLGSVFDSESDPARGLTWFLGGPFHVAGLHWKDQRWTEPFQSPKISIEPNVSGRYLPELRARGSASLLHKPILPGLLHTYCAWAPEREELLIVTVDPRKPSDYPLLVAARTPKLDAVRTMALRTSDGLFLPSPREILWMPTLGRLLIAPDFWDTLYLADPETGIAEPFLEAPLSNGGMLWSPELDRLLLTVPGELALWVVDPYQRRLERKLRTQPGVRPVAVDAANGLFVTASVITGTVMVQRLDDGEILDVFGSFMPMVRSLVLHPATGQAWLGTWSALYRFPYLRKITIEQAP